MMHIKVKCDCLDIPPYEREHELELPEGSTVSDILKALVEKGVGGLSYKEMAEGRFFVRNYCIISTETEVFDGDRVQIILTLGGG